MKARVPTVNRVVYHFLIGMHRLSEGFFKIPKIASLKNLLQKASEKLKANKNSRSYLKQKTVRVPCPL